MKTLYLIRHAHSASAASPQDDLVRPLSAQGSEDSFAVGQFMKTQGMYPDLILSSSSMRTAQTARAILGILFGKDAGNVSSRFDAKLYHASSETLLSQIHAVKPSVQRLMLVGHNPGIATLAQLLGKVENYTPGTLAVFTAEGDSWADFLPGKVKLEKVFAPDSNKNSADRYRP